MHINRIDDLIYFVKFDDADEVACKLGKLQELGESDESHELSRDRALGREVVKFIKEYRKRSCNVGVMKNLISRRVRIVDMFLDDRTLIVKKISQCIKDLEKTGYIEVIERGRGNNDCYVRLTGAGYGYYLTIK
ncbi:winged helix-turn-helix DNA-binding domain protein [Vibrio phage 1.113.A._10N.286.51.E7]|nr:winged helix-turn-helix DNA-binding domain protein [Vibrio phage 1.113.A._10N.286.51.E7]